MARWKAEIVVEVFWHGDPDDVELVKEAIHEACYKTTDGATVTVTKHERDE